MARPDSLAQALVEAASAFLALEPWNVVSDKTPFLVRVPEDALPLAAMVMGGRTKTTRARSSS